jgi:carbon storage regulator CsrA
MEVPMLVLTRKCGESIILDNHIVIQVVQISGNRVRIGIKAPPEVAIKREELAADPCQTVAAERPATRA